MSFSSYDEYEWNIITIEEWKRDNETTLCHILSYLLYKQLFYHFALSLITLSIGHSLFHQLEWSNENTSTLSKRWRYKLKYQDTVVVNENTHVVGDNDDDGE